MLKKILIMGVLIIMAFSLFACGSGNLPYNMKMHSHVREWLNDSFVLDNLTHGARSPFEGGYIQDDNFPKERIKIIDTEDKFNECFSFYPSEINFEEKIIIIYIFTSTAGLLPYYIENIELNENTLKIKYNKEKSKPNVGDATSPSCRYIVVELDKIEFNSVEFVKE